MEKQSTDTEQKTGSSMSWIYELQLSISPARPKLSRGSQTRLLCIILPKYQEELCVFIQSPKGLHTFQFLSSGNTLWKIQLLTKSKSTSSEVQASSAPFTSQHCQNFLYPRQFFFPMSMGETPGSILSLLQLLISLEATSACIWRLHLILRALTSQMLTPTTQVVCGSIGPLWEGQFLRRGGIMWF